MAGAARVGPGEQQDGGADAGIRPEDPAGQLDDALQPVVFDQHPAQGPVRDAGAEQHTVGHDHGRAAARPQQAQAAREKQQFGLPGPDQAQQVGVRAATVDVAGERRMGEDQGIGACLVRVRSGERIAMAEAGAFHAVQQQVHAADAQHGAVDLVAVEHAVMKVRGLLSVVQQAGMLPAQVFAGGGQESAGAGGRVAERVGRIGPRELHHEADDVAGRVERAASSGQRDPAEQGFVHGAPDVAPVQGDGVQQLHDPGQQRGRGEGEADVLHVAARGRVVVAQRLQERDAARGHHVEHGLRAQCPEDAPAQVVLVFPEREAGAGCGRLPAPPG